MDPIRRRTSGLPWERTPRTTRCGAPAFRTALAGGGDHATRVAKASSAAAMVCSTSSSVWAAVTYQTS